MKTPYPDGYSEWMYDFIDMEEYVENQVDKIRAALDKLNEFEQHISGINFYRDDISATIQKHADIIDDSCSELLHIGDWITTDRSEFEGYKYGDIE
jgi:methyl-accepting chemotaxis protein